MGCRCSTTLHQCEFRKYSEIFCDKFFVATEARRARKHLSENLQQMRFDSFLISIQVSPQRVRVSAVGSCQSLSKGVSEIIESRREGSYFLKSPTRPTCTNFRKFREHVSTLSASWIRHIQQAEFLAFPRWNVFNEFLNKFVGRNKTEQHRDSADIPINPDFDSSDILIKSLFNK